MKEDRKFGNDQLNTDPLSDNAAFEVDSIIAEFMAQPEPAEAPPEVGRNDHAEAEQPAEDDVVRVWSPKLRREAPRRESAAAPEPAPEEDGSAPELSTVDNPKREGVWGRLARRRARMLESLEAAHELTDEDALAFCMHKRKERRLPHLLSWLLTLFAALITLLPLQHWIDLSAILTQELCGVASIGVLLCQLLLTLPVLTEGVQKLLALRFSKESYLALTALVTLLYGLQALLTGSESSALCAAASLLLTVAQHADDLLTASEAVCLSRALSMESPTAVIRSESQWDGRYYLTRRPDRADELRQAVEARPSAEKRIGVYCLLLLSLTLVAALFAAVRGGRSFLWAWSILLLGSCPLGAFRAYGCSFRSLNRKLASSGAVVLGWSGASRMGGSLDVIVRDGDLFSKHAVVLNGIKVFGAHSPERLLGYAAAMLDRAGAGAAAAFSESLELRGCKHFHTDHFRVYDGGGLGAEIMGDVVLLGSRAFLRTMGVGIPPEARVEQALYISVNGEAAGLFALRYNASDSVRSGLASILGSRGLRPVLATRDALLSPERVGRIYSLPPERLEYPVLQDRLALSDPLPDRSGVCCALLARDTFLSFASAITAGRHLCRNLRQAYSIAVVGSVVGFLTMVLLALLGAAASASAANLILYHLVWLVPSLWLTSLLGG